jgi:hypothetical protein
MQQKLGGYAIPLLWEGSGFDFAALPFPKKYPSMSVALFS